jgi:hypothetical protein
MAAQRRNTTASRPLRAIDRVSIHELRARLARLAGIDLKAFTVGQLEQRIGLILNQIPLLTYPLIISGVYRARSGADYKNVRDLWYPPKGISKLGRLNEAGKVVFYAANTPHTAFLELRPAVGQRYTVLLARSKKATADLSVIVLGITEARSSDIAAIRGTLREMDAALLKSMGNANYKKYALLDRWLTSSITAEVPSDQPELYKPTAALANLLFRAPIDAVTYPSVATDMNGMNICLLPNRADELLVASEAWEFEIIQRARETTTNRRLYKFRTIRKTSSIESDGSLIWGPEGIGVGSDDLRMFARGQLGRLAGLPIDDVSDV